MAGVDTRQSGTATGVCRTITAMSFNMAHGLGMDGTVDLGRIAEVIGNSEADLIGLQEVDHHFSARSGYEDQAAILAEMLGMEYSYGPNLIEPPVRPGEPERQYGNAILSRFPVKFTTNHRYSSHGTDRMEDPEPRGVQEAVLDLGNTYLSFFNTHMSLGQSTFRENVQQLQHIASLSAFPTVITGDFNVRDDHPDFQPFRTVFQDTFGYLGKTEAYTYPSRYNDTAAGIQTEPTSRIDYIFTDTSIVVKDAEVLDTSAADHLPIVASLDILTNRPMRREGGQFRQVTQ